MGRLKYNDIKSNTILNKTEVPILILDKVDFRQVLLPRVKRAITLQ